MTSVSSHWTRCSAAITTALSGSNPSARSAARIYLVHTSSTLRPQLRFHRSMAENRSYRSALLLGLTDTVSL